MKTKWKVAIIIFSYIIIGFLYKFEPAVNTALAVNQANDTVNSTYAFTSYQDVRQWLWVLYVVIPVLLFAKQIKGLFIRNKGEV